MTFGWGLTRAALYASMDVFEGFQSRCHLQTLVLMGMARQIIPFLHLVQFTDKPVEGKDHPWLLTPHGKALWDGDSSLAWETGDLFP